MSTNTGITSFLQLKKDRRASRFTLLFLEYNEFLLQDLAVYKYEAPTELSWVRSVAGRVGGRLKLCTRGLIFEPTTDSRAPIIRYPFKSMISPIKPYKLAQGSALATGIDASSLFYFESNLCIDIEVGGRVAPFVTHEFKTPIGFVFQLRHSTVTEFLELACELQRIESLRNSFSDSKKLLRNILNDAMGVGIGGPQFELRNLVDFSEKILTSSAIRVDRIRPLVRNPGILIVTNREIYFQPSNVNNTGETVEHFPLKRIATLVRRRHMLRHTGLELSLDDLESTAFFNFESPRVRDEVWAVLNKQPVVQQAVNRSSDLRRMVLAWQNREISNFEYLSYLNSIADRSIHDLTQYPVFPWVICDYESSQLDLENPNTFRDLSKPMGALDEQRLQYFLERFEMMPPEDPSTGMPPPFLYGSHYSTPGFVLFYLVRSAPQHMLSLQSGKFDAADRMFSAVGETFISATKNPSDVKELVPEFYQGDGSFLLNDQDLPLGVQQDGQALHHVKLPPWSRSPRDFVKKCRKALDCDYVSNHIHLWIDLIFGYKQRGQAAIDAHNLFYYLTYEGAVDLESIEDPNKRAALESQINEFGQCPKQLFLSNHPSRNAPTSALNDLVLASANPVSSSSSSSSSSTLPQPPPPPSRPVTSGAEEQIQSNPVRVNADGGPSEGGGGGGGGVEEQSSGLGFRVWNRVGSSVENMFSRIKEISTDTSPSLTQDKGGLRPNTSYDQQQQHQPQQQARYGNTSNNQQSTHDQRNLNNPTHDDLSNIKLPPPTFGTDPTDSILPASPTLPTPPPPDMKKKKKQSTTDVVPSNQAEQSNIQDPPSLERTSGDSGSDGGGGGKGVQEKNKLEDQISDASSSGSTDDEDDETHQLALQSLLDDEELNELREEKDKLDMASNKYNQSFSLPTSSVATMKITPVSSAPATPSLTMNDEANDPGQCGKLKLVAAAEGMRVHKDTVTAAKFSVDGEVAVSTSRDGSLRVTPLTSFSSPMNSPPQPLVSKSSGGGSLNANNPQRRLFQATELPLSSCSLVDISNGSDTSASSSSLGVICGSWDNTIFLYSVSSACVLGRRINAHDDSVSCVASEKHLVASGSWDATVKVWSLKKGRSRIAPRPAAGSGSTSSTTLPYIGIDSEPLLELFDHENPVCCVALDPSLRFIASGADDGRIVIHALPSGDFIETIELSALYDSPPHDTEKGYAITSLFWSDHIYHQNKKNYLSTLFVCSRYGKLHEFATSGQCLKTVDTFGFGSNLSPLCLSIRGSLVACGGEGGFVQVWSWKPKESISSSSSISSLMRIGEPLIVCEEKKLHPNHITSVSLDVSGRQLLTGCDMGIKLFTLLPAE